MIGNDYSYFYLRDIDMERIYPFLKNQTTGEMVYTPPSGEREILELMSNLEKYLNDDYDAVDPLVKLTVIHYQFESIHPFYDGNGRTGRIINVLYLVLKELLDSPILKSNDRKSP